LKADELERFGLIQFPMIMGGVVPIINLAGVQTGELRLSNAVLADIFLGKITIWNDPIIAELNTGISLPDQEITIVHRADGSGTTNIFTHYLGSVSPEWKSTVGVGKSVDWPMGVGGKGNEGVAAYVQKIQGAIGYVEYAYALLNNQTTVSLNNQAGNFVAPTIETFQAAAENADWENAPGFYLFLTNQPGENSWPITGVSYILIAKEQQDAATSEAMLTFFDWCYTHGPQIAQELHYVPMPENVVRMVELLWGNEVTVQGKSAWLAR
jgi:phosphate transport system substrate-binding protein